MWQWADLALAGGYDLALARYLKYFFKYRQRAREGKYFDI